MRVKFLLFAACVFAVTVFFSMGRAGGDLTIRATVTAMDDEVIYATVTDQQCRIFNRLPKNIRISRETLSDDEDITALKTGDVISCVYKQHFVEGDLVTIIYCRIIGRSDGERFFSAMVTAMDDEMICAEVKGQESRFFNRLQKNIRIPTELPLDEGVFSALQVGDLIRCMYLPERTDGDLVPICSFSIIEKTRLE